MLKGEFMLWFLRPISEFMGTVFAVVAIFMVLFIIAAMYSITLEISRVYKNWKNRT